MTRIMMKLPKITAKKTIHQEIKPSTVRFWSFFICLLLGMLIAGIAVGSMWAKLKTVHMKSNASDYTKPENLVLKVNNDTFLSKKVDKAAIPSNNH
jgi:hypothetical protein